MDYQVEISNRSTEYSYNKRTGLDISMCESLTHQEYWKPCE